MPPLETQAAIVEQPHRKPCARERLLLEAADLFSRKGYTATSVGEIVAAAGVSKPVLYYHFKSKEGLYLRLMEHGLDMFRATIDAARHAPGGTASGRIAHLCQAVIELALGNEHIVRLTRGSHYVPPPGAPAFDVREFHRIFRDAIHALVDQGLRSGEFAAVPREDLAWAIMGLLSACVDSNIGDPELALKPPGFRAALNLVLAGVTPAGRRNEGVC